MEGIVLFSAVMISCIVASVYAIISRRNAISEVKQVLTLRAYGIMILAGGYVLHTLGNFLSPYYGPSLELILESIAHGVIMIAFFLFYKTARKAVTSSKGYWFK